MIKAELTILSPQESPYPGAEVTILSPETEHVEPMLRRELGHRGIAASAAGVSDLLLAWLEIDAASA